MRPLFPIGALHILLKGAWKLDYEREIVGLREQTAALRADVDNLCGWQRTQNGSLQRLDAKVDEIYEIMDTKVDGIYKIMIGTAGTAALSFLGTIITLLVVLSNRN